MTKPCAVPDCPALAVGRLKTCQQHEFAATANALGVAGRTCLDCRRHFRKEDYVLRAKDYEKDGYRHVHCDLVQPRESKQTLRDAPKPLLEAADDAERDRGAA